MSQSSGSVRRKTKFHYIKFHERDEILREPMDKPVLPRHQPGHRVSMGAVSPRHGCYRRQRDFDRRDYPYGSGNAGSFFHPADKGVARIAEILLPGQPQALSHDTDSPYHRIMRLRSADIYH